MNDTHSHSFLKVKGSVSGKLTGPIGPIPLGGSIEKGDFIYIVSFSEVIVCDWPCREEIWVREPLVIPKSSGYAFAPGAIKGIQLAARPCSMSSHSDEDSGWAVDGWKAEVISEALSSCDYIQVTLAIAIQGKGTRLHRFGYMWTAYVSEIRQIPSAS